jgi:phage gp29-like protein
MNADRARELARRMLEEGVAAARAGVPAGAVAQQLMAAVMPDRPRFDEPQEAMEELVQESMRAGGQPIPPSRIRAAILEATGPDDLVERLAALFDAFPNAAYREVMERALFAADVMGYAHQARAAGERTTDG